MHSTERMSDLKMSVYWSSVTECPVLQIETGVLTEEMRVDLNDGVLWLGDPEKTSMEAGRRAADRENGSRDKEPDVPRLIEMAEALAEIANGLGSQEEWSSDELEWIPMVIAKVLPHPGDQSDPGEYVKRTRAALKAATGKSGK